MVYDIRQWRTSLALRQHLSNYDPSIAPWARGVVLHHTWKPTPETWRGLTTMRAMLNYYAELGWDRGPHLFVVHGSARPSDDGIWQMTPLNLVGIHAGKANAWAWGIEVVGNFDLAPWSPAVHSLVKGTTQALMDWRRLPVTRQSLIGHREVPSTKSCPGSWVNMDAVRQDFTKA